MVDKWEKCVTVQNCELGNSVCPAEAVSIPPVVHWGGKGGKVGHFFMPLAFINITTIKDLFGESDL